MVDKVIRQANAGAAAGAAETARALRGVAVAAEEGEVAAAGAEVLEGAVVDTVAVVVVAAATEAGVVAVVVVAAQAPREAQAVLPPRRELVSTVGRRATSHGNAENPSSATSATREATSHLNAPMPPTGQISL